MTVIIDEFHNLPALPLLLDKSNINVLQGSNVSGALTDIIGNLGFKGILTIEEIVFEDSQLSQLLSKLVHFAFKFLFDDKLIIV